MSKNEEENSVKIRKQVICISGMAGTGKSTLARRLAKKYGLKYYSGGDALKTLAAEQGCNVSSNGWWESDEGLIFLRQRERDSQFDKAVDDKLLQYAQEGGVLFDSWTMPWLLKSGFKIWLLASIEKRAERVADRDKIALKEALRVLKEKEAITKAIYRRLYGFTLGEDFTPFNLVLDTNNLNAEEVFQTLCSVLDNVVLKSHS